MAASETGVRPALAKGPQASGAALFGSCKLKQLVWSGGPSIFTVQGPVCLDAHRVLAALATHRGMDAV